MTVGSVPRFSICTPVHDPPLDLLRACLDSIVAQTFGDWELCLVDDGSQRAEVLDELRARAAGDRRIRLVERADGRRHRGGIERRTRTRRRRVRRARRPRRPSRGRRAGTRRHGDRRRPDDRLSLHRRGQAVARRLALRHVPEARLVARTSPFAELLHPPVGASSVGRRGRRWLPRRFRRFAGPRPDPAGHRTCTNRPPRASGAVPLVHHAGLGCRRRRCEAVRTRGGSACRRRALRSPRHRRDRRTPRHPGALSSPSSPSDVADGQHRDPHRWHRASGVGDRAPAGARCGVVGARGLDVSERRGRGGR